MVVHDSMHLMELTYVNVGSMHAPYESFCAKDSLELLENPGIDPRALMFHYVRIYDFR